MSFPFLLFSLISFSVLSFPFMIPLFQVQIKIYPVVFWILHFLGPALDQGGGGVYYSGVDIRDCVDINIYK